MKEVKLRAIIWGLFAFGIYIVCLIYVSAFCAIYTKTKTEFLISSFFTLLIHMIVIQPMSSLIKTVCRTCFKGASCFKTLTGFEKRLY